MSQTVEISLRIPSLRVRKEETDTLETINNSDIRFSKQIEVDSIPKPGVVLTMADWEALAARVEAAGVVFGIAPHVRFKGQVGEQATMFFRDPSGNALEFKAFADDSMLFAS